MFFFFNDTATTEIYTLSLHDALPILESKVQFPKVPRRTATSIILLAVLLAGIITPTGVCALMCERHEGADPGDRKSTRLNSSHVRISYAVFCLKKKNIIHRDIEAK